VIYVALPLQKDDFPVRLPNGGFNGKIICKCVCFFHCQETWFQEMLNPGSHLSSPKRRSTCLSASTLASATALVALLTAAAPAASTTAGRGASPALQKWMK